MLGLALRRYSEGEGFQAAPLGPGPHYFPVGAQAGAQPGEVDELAAHWNVQPGMKPIRWLISPLVKQAGQRPELQELGIDLVAVVKAGIESWNSAFGFPVLEARMADADDSFADDDKNYFIWDVESQRRVRLRRLAHQPQHRRDPRRQRLLQRCLRRFRPGRLCARRTGAHPGSRRRPGPGPSARAWPGSRSRAGPLCDLKPSPLARQRKQLPLGEGLPATAKERVEKAIASIVAHEIGHTLGLRHNFKGSLLPPSSSVMDYNSDQLMAAAAIPGRYDVAAIRTSTPVVPGRRSRSAPTSTSSAIPRCAQFDEGADPLQEFWGPFYQAASRFYLTTGQAFGGADLRPGDGLS